MENTYFKDNINSTLNLLAEYCYKKATQAFQSGEVPIAAAIYDLRSNKIIASAFNKVETEKTAIAHAEILAIKQASKKRGDWRLEDTIIYSTIEPCPMCASAIRLARIPIISFGAEDLRNGAFGSYIDLSKDNNLGPDIKLYKGILKDKCLKLLKMFFSQKRAVNKLNKTLKQNSVDSLFASKVI